MIVAQGLLQYEEKNCESIEETIEPRGRRLWVKGTPEATRNVEIPNKRQQKSENSKIKLGSDTMKKKKRRKER